MCIALAISVIAAGCARSAGQTQAAAPEARETALRQIASDYAASGDLAQAEAALTRLELANPGQLLVSMAEADASAGRPAESIAPLARLADALGARSLRLAAYLNPTPTLPPPSPTPAPASPTALPSATPTLSPPAAAPPADTPTPVPPSPTAVPQKPRVVAGSDVNVRAGPGRTHPAIGRLRAGQEVEIVGRNASGDWWQLAWPGAAQAWVAGTVVRVLGPIDTVGVAELIPTPPPQPTAAPRPTAAPTAAPQPAGPDFRLVSVRLWGVIENGGYYDGPSIHCGEKRQLRVLVLDAAGNPLNGVTIKSVYTGEEQVTGSKGPGTAEYILGNGQDVYIVRDADGREVTSDYARGMSTQPEGISQEQLIAAGYCTDAASCAHHLEQSCRGHYSWDATFRRAY